MGHRDKFLKAKKAGTEITPAQKECLDVIRRHCKRHGYPPTYRDLAMETKTTLNAVFETVCRLERDGYVRRLRMTSRTLTVTEKGWAVP
jgi:SOS-response transcriptional repressor LexA